MGLSIDIVKKRDLQLVKFNALRNCENNVKNYLCAEREISLT